MINHGKIKLTLFLFVLITVLFIVWPKTFRSFGDTHLSVFQKEAVRWIPDSLDSYSPEDEAGLIHLGNGRIILKKISLPNYIRDITATITVRVESAGDRWDKTGSVFVIPDGSDINMMTVADSSAAYPEVDPDIYENLVGVAACGDYSPVAELLRFMTPFGVGHYSRLDTAKVSKTRPVYIDGWAPEAVWQADITDLYPLLKGDAYVGVFIDTWTPEGYIASVDIDIKESKNKYAHIAGRHVLPLANTVYYFGQEYPDIFARKDLTVDFELPQVPSKAHLAYITTGHGGHSEGDEFTKQRNVVSLDGEVLIDYVPWRTDCASFRRFNPTSGVWTEHRTASYYGLTAKGPGRVEKEIDELIASSDYSRSNWCPGSQVDPVIVPLEDLAAGAHRLTISIPGAQPRDGEKMNFWLTSAYLVWEE